jgi:hypothetical protein
MTEYRMGRRRTVTDKPLKRYEPLELLGKLHKADSTQARRVLVREAMGGLFYAWGNKRKPWKDWLTYEENMNESRTNSPSST